jgi:hypothetical protein
MVHAIYDNKTRSEISESSSLDEFRRLVYDRQKEISRYQEQKMKDDNATMNIGYQSLKTFDTASVTSSKISSDISHLLLDQRDPEDTLLMMTESDTCASSNASNSRSFREALEEFLSESETEPVTLMSDDSSSSAIVRKIRSRQVARRRKVVASDERDEESGSEDVCGPHFVEPATAKPKRSTRSRRPSNSVNRTSLQQGSLFAVPYTETVVFTPEEEDSSRGRSTGNQAFYDTESSYAESHSPQQESKTEDDDDHDDKEEEDSYVNADEIVVQDVMKDEDGSGWLPGLFKSSGTPLWGWAGALGGVTDVAATSVDDAVPTSPPSTTPSTKDTARVSVPTAKWEPPFRNFTKDATLMFSGNSFLPQMTSRQLSSYSKTSQSSHETEGQSALTGIDFNTMRAVAPDPPTADTPSNRDETSIPRSVTPDTVSSKHFSVKTFTIQSEYMAQKDGIEIDDVAVASRSLGGPHKATQGNGRNRKNPGRNGKNRGKVHGRVFKMLRKKLGKALRRLNIRVSDKFLSKCARGAKKLVGSFKKAMGSKKGPQEASTLRGLPFLNDVERPTNGGIQVDEVLATELLNDRGDDTSIVRASKYVVKGKELLQEAAKIKSDDPVKCKTITAEAHTYAYVARQMAKTALMTKQAQKEALSASPTPMLNVISSDGEDEYEQRAIEAENKGAMFDFDAFLSHLTCFTACSNSSNVDHSTAEVEAALQILAKISEEEKMTTLHDRSLSKECINTSKSNLPHRSSGGSIDNMAGRKSPESINNMKETTVGGGGTSSLNDLVSNIQSFYETDLVVSSSSADSRTEHGDHSTASVSDTLTSRDDEYTVETEPTAQPTTRNLFNWGGGNSYVKPIPYKNTDDDDDDDDDDDEDDEDDDYDYDDDDEFDEDDTVTSLGASQSESRTTNRSFVSETNTSDHPFRYSSSSFSQSVTSAGTASQRTSGSTRRGRGGRRSSMSDTQRRQHPSRSGVESSSLRNKNSSSTGHRSGNFGLASEGGGGGKDIVDKDRVDETTGGVLGTIPSNPSTATEKKKHRFSWRMGGSRKVDQ